MIFHVLSGIERLLSYLDRDWAFLCQGSGPLTGLPLKLILRNYPVNKSHLIGL